MKTLLATFAWLVLGIPFATADPPQAPSPRATLALEPTHPWRPPFHLDRVGRPVAVLVGINQLPPPAKFQLAQVHDGRESARRDLEFSTGAPFIARVEVDGHASEVILFADAVEVDRLAVPRPEFEAEAVARPETVVNPVDLGTILPPSDWLLLGPGQSGVVEVAAILRGRDEPAALVTAWFASEADRRVSRPLPLADGTRAMARVDLPHPATSADRDVLHVALTGADGEGFWSREVPVMLVREVADRPAFGAYETKLRYDAPISVRDPATGAFSSLDYAKGWNPALQDVVVRFPNGARFVFWRGSSYVPFWAGRHNTGACYEWAEVLTRQPDAVDCVEPLMDKELRYGRVTILESTPARVRVRWTYQSTDLNYQVWGDQAVEDYTFYPDGFGTRVVSLKTDPATEYELSELIVLTPQGAFPFDVLPEDLVDAIALDGTKRAYRFPIRNPSEAPNGGAAPAIYRLRLNRREEQAAICFNPGDRAFPPVVFGPFQDQGLLVTPCYWGSHWPLARGNATGSKIDDRIAISPCHNSVMSWAASRPDPIAESRGTGLDAAGKARPLAFRRWAWLIGMTDADDDRLLQWARSYTRPPSLTVTGGQVAFEGWSPERRSVSLAVDGLSIEVAIRPEVPCVNPVFELIGAPKGEPRLFLDDAPLAPDLFAWDGRTLWLDVTLAAPTRLKIDFDATGTDAGGGVDHSSGER
ncbi:hypothetical protein [Planctomyces sp. SH-PL62]|uniref:hypothetical protein n=1 Tax=Planctomyces sp. SH-PL62 TaxID=1636152 RepID=UPI00078D5D11|nr:hypothetical protein [Planctomyces sp. SH-PL62]AMV38950.1 hypothetical protein VT85_16055 [Planctomyces sp. SH-PL62]